MSLKPKAYILNEVTLKAGLVVNGFGKGKWAQLQQDDTFKPEAELMFDIPDMSEPIVLENVVTTVAEALKDKSEPRVQYHKLAEMPGKPAEYKITQDEWLAVSVYTSS